MSLTALAAATTPRSRITRVLLVDPDAALGSVHAEALRAMGFQVQVAHSADSARRIIARDEFEVIVSDVSLGGADSFSFAVLESAHAKDPDIPVLLTTAAPRLETAIDALEQGALQYLVKPFAVDLLCQSVTKAARLHHLAKLKRATLTALGNTGFRPGDYTLLERGFTRALDSLWMAYQPISDRRGRIFGYEALVRTTEPSLQNPAEFLFSAERLGRLHELGQIIRRTVAECAANAPPKLAFFVNLHPFDLMDDELFASDSPLSRHARSVILEVTERASLDGIKDVAAKVQMLRDLGYRVAIDDLGAGYAGLTSFARLEPDAVKLDMDLVRGADEQTVKKNLIRSLVRVCKEMNMLVVAEGIQTMAEYAVVKSLGCQLFQGFFVGRPVPPDALPWRAKPAR